MQEFTTEEQFCEFVSKQAHTIAAYILAGRDDDAAELALKLCSTAITRKQQLKGQPPLSQPDPYDLTTLVIAANPPAGE